MIDFQEKKVKNNTGFFLLAIIIILLIIVMILFCVKGYNKLEEKTDEVISIKFKNEKDLKKDKTNNSKFNSNSNKKRLEIFCFPKLIQKVKLHVYALQKILSVF